MKFPFGLDVVFLAGERVPPVWLPATVIDVDGNHVRVAFSQGTAWVHECKIDLP
jgi:hypothetical protein